MLKRLFILLILPVLLLSTCCKDFGEWETLTIKEGSHGDSGLSLRISQDEYLEYQYVFTQSVQYSFDNINQCDWNKLMGWSFHPYGSNHKNSAMVAWRYDLDGSILLAPYYHKDELTLKTEYDCTGYISGIDNVFPVIKIPRNEIVNVALSRFPSTRATFIEIWTSGNDRIEHRFEFNIDLSGPVREIFVWFGGDEEAPSDMQILRKLVRRY